MKKSLIFNSALRWCLTYFCPKSKLTNDALAGDQASLVNLAMELACNADKPDFIKQIFCFVKEHQINDEIKNLFAIFNQNKKIQNAINVELYEFIKNILPPYNIVEFARLGIENQAKYLDPMTCQIINFPVTLFGHTYDFDTLDMLDIQQDGYRSNPFDREKFTMLDVKPDITFFDSINAEKAKALAAHHAALKRMYDVIVLDDVDELQSIVESNPKVNINENVKNGFSCLYYACSLGKKKCAKFLMAKGADLDLRSFSKNHAMATELKQYLLDLIQEKIDKNSPEGHMRLGKLYRDGVMVGMDITKALLHFEKAGDFGDLNGYLQCADIYADGLYGTKQRYDLSLRFCDKAIDKYDAISAKIKKAILLANKGTVSLDAIGIKLTDLATIAASFDPDAQFLYSLCFRSLWSGVSISELKYIKYLKHAAEGGCVLAMVQYAMCLQDGSGVEQSFTEAGKLFKQAADRGNAIAQSIYAAYCEHGRGMEKNIKEAIKYYKIAAENENEISLANMAAMSYADMCTSGVSIPKDWAEAAIYYKMAADRMDVVGMHNYATCCKYAFGVKNMNAAALYFQRAADSGFAPSQFMYAQMCLYGDGIEKNIATAVKYCKMAAESGYAPAVEELKAMPKLMTPLEAAKKEQARRNQARRHRQAAEERAEAARVEAEAARVEAEAARVEAEARTRAAARTTSMAGAESGRAARRAAAQRRIN